MRNVAFLLLAGTMILASSPPVHAKTDKVFVFEDYPAPDFKIETLQFNESVDFVIEQYVAQEYFITVQPNAQAPEFVSAIKSPDRSEIEIANPTNQANAPNNYPRPANDLRTFKKKSAFKRWIDVHRK